MIGPSYHMPGVVYPPENVLERYLELGELTRETLVDGFAAVVEKYGDRVAVLGPDGQYSYKELDKITDRLAGALLRLGLRPLDRVIFQVGNSQELVMFFVACLKASLIPLCTLPSHREHEIGYLGELSAARLHLVQGDDPRFDDVAFANKMRNILPTVQWVIQTRGQPRDGALGMLQLVQDIDLKEARALLKDVPHDPFQVAVFQLSGGTTGVPKIIPRFHNEYLYNMRSVARINGYTPEDVLFTPLPMVHNLNMGCCFGPFLMTGGAIVISRSMRTEDLVQVLDTYQPTWGSIGAVLPRIQPALESGELKLNRLRGVISANDAPRIRQVVGAPVRHIFGMTEGVIMLTREGDPQEVQDFMVGRPVSPLDQVKLLVPGTEEEITEDGIEGECVFAGPYTIHGYYMAEERNNEAFTSDGFYRSGDLMRIKTINGVRYFQFRGRTKDIVSRGGEKINCEEVETIIRRHPDVLNVQICAMPDPVMGERACAYIQPRKGVWAPTVAELGGFLEKEGLAKFKWPERVEAVEEFPTTQSGKLSKAILRQLITDKLAAEAAELEQGEIL